MEAIEQNSTDAEEGTCGEYDVQFWIHRQLYRIPPRVGGRHVTPGVCSDPW
jgi:hypothetical protein